MKLANVTVDLSEEDAVANPDRALRGLLEIAAGFVDDSEGEERAALANKWRRLILLSV